MLLTQNASDTKIVKCALARNSAQLALASSSLTSGKSEKDSLSQRTASTPAKTRFSSATSSLSLIHLRKKTLSMCSIIISTETLTIGIQKIAQVAAEEFQRRTVAVGEADSLSKFTILTNLGHSSDSNPLFSQWMNENRSTCCNNEVIGISDMCY